MTEKRSKTTRKEDMKYNIFKIKDNFFTLQITICPAIGGILQLQKVLFLLF